MIFRRKKTTPPAVPSRIPEITDTAGVPEPGADSKKVLVADDDPIIRQALSLKLKSRGYRVITAGDCSEALIVSRLEKPDVMVLDIDFPPDVAHGGAVPWNGFLLSQWLRRNDGAKNTPVIFMSANDKTEYQQRASAAGGTDFLSKPIDGDRLLASIDCALSGRASARPAKSETPLGAQPVGGIGSPGSDELSSGKLNHLSIGGL